MSRTVLRELSRFLSQIVKDRQAKNKVLFMARSYANECMKEKKFRTPKVLWKMLRITLWWGRTEIRAVLLHAKNSFGNAGTWNDIPQKIPKDAVLLCKKMGWLLDQKCPTCGSVLWKNLEGEPETKKIECLGQHDGNPCRKRLPFGLPLLPERYKNCRVFPTISQVFCIVWQIVNDMHNEESPDPMAVTKEKIEQSLALTQTNAITFANEWFGIVLEATSAFQTHLQREETGWTRTSKIEFDDLWIGNHKWVVTRNLETEKFSTRRFPSGPLLTDTIPGSFANVLIEKTSRWAYTEEMAAEVMMCLTFMKNCGPKAAFFSTLNAIVWHHKQ